MRDGRDRYLATLLGILFSFTSFGQEIRVEGGFVEDSLGIGENINFWITASYNSDVELVFPDSGYAFTPFEFSKKEFFPTQLRDEVAFDSTTYTLQSFEIDLIQYLQLPAYVLDGTDTTIFQTGIDSIYLRELAPMVSDTTQLIANVNYQEVNTLFNFPLLYMIGGGLFLVAVVLLLVFGNKIIRYFKLRKLRRDYENFSTQLANYIEELKVKPEAEAAELALVTWKKYQERLDKFPFTKLTTKEILGTNFTKELEKPLKSIDRLVYGRRPTDTVYQDFQQIEDFTQHRYNRKVSEIKDGKQY